MPIKKCTYDDKKCISENIAMLVKEGKPHEQAVAIALDDARRVTYGKKGKNK